MFKHGPVADGHFRADREALDHHSGCGGIRRHRQCEDEGSTRTTTTSDSDGEDVEDHAEGAGGRATLGSEHGASYVVCPERDQEANIADEVLGAGVKAK